MLICPQCQFENPNTNKFCQRCGTSLTQKVCPDCGTYVALNAKNCHNCGATTGTFWWAIIAKEGTENGGWAYQPAVDGEQEGDISPAAISPSFLSTQLPAGAYLDSQQRYQLLDSLPPLATAATPVEANVRVLDCQPFQLSPLLAILANRPDDAAMSSGEVSNDFQIAVAIPDLAKAYVALESQFNEAIPALHDAWQQDGVQVVLIEDRTDLPSLLDFWQEEHISSLQILHWFYEMTQLWAGLEPWRCRQSLLELSNLRLDEDQALALQRLYMEPQPSSDESQEGLSLKDLARVWQALFQRSQRTQLGSVVQLLSDIEVGTIQTLAELRSRLEAIATEFQTNLTPPAMPSDEYHIDADPDQTREDSEVSSDAANIPTVPELNYPEETINRGDDMPTIVLPMQLINLEDAGRTDVGRQRHHNEDYYGIDTKISKQEYPNSRSLQARGVYILCDGMGGHAGGEVASTLAVKTLWEYFHTRWTTPHLPNEDSIREAMRLANQAIYDVNQEDARAGIGRMGTTVVMVLIQDSKVAVAHVGDSRLYRVTRKRGLEQVTVDHEVGQREILRGVPRDIAYGRPDAYQLTQALGPRDENFINPDVQFFELNEDTLLILASDGLSDNDLLENHYHSHLEHLLSSRTNLEQGVYDLIELANQYNGHDNITAVLIRAKVRPNLDHPVRA